MGKQWGQGPDAVRAFFDATLRRFYRAMHQICRHRVDLVDAGTPRAWSTAVPNTKTAAAGSSRRSSRATITSGTPTGGDTSHAGGTTTGISSDVLERPAQRFQSWPGWEGSRPDLPHLFPTCNGSRTRATRTTSGS